MAPEIVTDENGDDAVLRRYRKSLTRSGSSGGVSLHFDAETAKEYGLDPETEVEVDVIAEDGDITFQIRDIPAGFTRAALHDYAERQNWTETDSYLTEEEWSLTYRDPTGLVRVEIDSTTHVDGTPVNNVFIQGDPIRVDEDLERYRDLCMTANEHDLGVRVRDSEGLWAQLQSSSDQDTGDAPDGETFRQLLDAAETVRVQLITEMPSLNSTLEDISRRVNAIQDAMQEYDDLVVNHLDL